MKSGSRGAEPARVEAVRRRFKLWRRTRQGRARIPGRLWAAAVKLAVAYGLCRTARALGLDYNALKRRVASADPGGSPGARVARQEMATAKITRPKTPGQNPAMTFVELPPLERPGSPECVVELENPRGAKMQIRLTGHQNADVVTAVSQVFFGTGS